MSAESNRIPVTDDRKLFKIHGGIHPEQNKDQSTSSPIKKAGIPPLLILPLQQHIGAPAKPVVAIGDKVLKGQLVAEDGGFVSAAVHAPSSGTVIDISEHPVQHPSFIEGKCILIETDGLDQWIELDPTDDFRQLDKATLLSKIKQAGIAGKGGAGFPSAVKLNVRADNPIKTLVLNSVECEPYITADDMLIRERADNILKGLEIIAHIVEPEEVLIAIEDNKPEAIASYHQALEKLQLPFEVAVVPTLYPSGGEKQIIQILTGKEVPQKGLPSDIGVVCLNTGTTAAIYNAITNGQPLISRITTLTGKALGKPQNYEALIGTPFSFLLEAAELDQGKLSQLTMGGPMMGFAVHDINVPLVKTTNCILATEKNELISTEMEQACIRCGSCAEACPATLLPQQLYFYSKTKELEKAEEYQLADCIECGACSYVCPSNIPLVQYFRFAKGEIRKKTVELQKSENSRERFEFRLARLEKEEAAKEAKRKEKELIRQQKKQAAAEKAKNAPTETNHSEIDLQALKTKAATLSKQWKQAEKSLQAAAKAEDENIEALTKKVSSLEKLAQQAQQNLADQLNKSKAATDTAANTDTINQLKISLATSNAQIKKLEASLNDDSETDSKTKTELNLLLNSAKQKSAEYSAELEKLK